MSTKSGTYKGHRFHGDPIRFEVVANFIFETWKRDIKYIADVAGGRGMLSRLLNKKFNYESTVIDPRGYSLVGVSNIKEEYHLEDASYYDLVVGLHPDQATRVVAESALVTNTLLIPCCNFWNKTTPLNTNELINEISKYYDDNNVKYEKITLNFSGPKNIALATFRN
ncbi:hypothetical protein CO178_01085 [candidate division WWE3 bacterium CG_4_9_14_3_um_filter_34_6]|uniref:Class I SAM-dependent methyltransferase n=1 Tax=candidate division WWE3 bacterium CG_4_9_14_3_um_filter_34_6 TaxID=1975079 RepID=A0A2M7X4B4_UNCKA|nr:MAG: hypothetical protein CO178_01085 [candidate division WWE3 bacterium CG_4_9_14_3_um_filter_34_6]